MKTPATENEGSFINTLAGSHLDWFYGGGDTSWPNTATAVTYIPVGKRAGLTIGVLVNSVIVEYWWPNPSLTADTDLVVKSSGTGGGTTTSTSMAVNVFTLATSYADGTNFTFRWGTVVQAMTAKTSPDTSGTQFFAGPYTSDPASQALAYFMANTVFTADFYISKSGTNTIVFIAKNAGAQYSFTGASAGQNITPGGTSGTTILDTNTTTGVGVIGLWTGTQAQYDAIGTKSANILYFVS